MDHRRGADIGLGPGGPAAVGHGVSGQTVQGKVVGGVGQLGLGAQYKHRQALERGGQQVAAADQQHFGGAALEADEAGLHAALGRQKGCEAGLVHAQQGEILGELAVQKLGGVFAFHANHAQVGQGGNAVQGVSHR